MRWGALLGVWLCFGASAANAAPEELRVAVVVGSDDGLRGEAPLDYAEADARRFHQLLLHAGSVAPEHAFLVTEGGADGVRLALARARELLARARRQGPGALVFYVSAHADAESLHLAGTRLPLAELRRLLADMPATLRLALVDACRTPAVARAKGGTPSTAEVPVRLEAPSEVEGTVWLMASSEGEPAQEWASLRGALFTHHVLAGLRGLADADDDGAVTLAELYTHAWRHTLASSALSGAGAQHPSFDIRLSGWGEWVLARPAGMGASLVLGEDVEGHLWVADHQQELVAELHKARGSSTRLAVRPGRYRVVRPEGTFAEAVDVQLGWRAERVLTRSDFLRVPLQRARWRGGTPLALRPWEASVGYAVSSGSLQGLGAAHFGEVGLRHRWSRSVARARLGLTRAGMERESFTLSQTELQVALGGGLLLPAGPVELTVGAEARATWVWQSLRRVDEEQAGRIFGVGEAGRWGIIPGLGPFVAATYPLAERLQLGVEGAAGVTHAPRYDGKAELQPSVQLRAALHVAL
ncbi:caspase family protein [Pyxidicoccus xibeiensis]|uniref:caspase family protein n=1 Tax=Pyxidicoccus xibeiensis TaxID=2906759 RepID=UPI0020A73D0E|nr:caspase family protein [Pyxidicoccus xibeiensis]MCP3142408.1 caspase family protein [Pyxidicoccus xibeiensis]